MSRISLLNHTKEVLWRLALGVSITLLLASSQVFADEAKISELLIEAETALENNQYQEAARAYREAAELSDDPEVAQQATRIGYSYGFDEDALRAARRWIKLEQDNDEALLYVAQLYLRTGSIRRSQRSFEKLLERGQEPADQRLLALIPFLSREDPESAYDLMRRLARPYKDSAEAHYAVAVMALQADDAEEAAKRAQESVRDRTGLGQATPIICTRDVDEWRPGWRHRLHLASHRR